MNGTTRSRSLPWAIFVWMWFWMWPPAALSAEFPQEAPVQAAVGFSVLGFHYAEYDDDGSLLDYEYGAVPGIVVDVSRFRGGWFVAGRFGYHAGDVLYDGQTQSGTPVTSRTDEKILDLFLQVGRRMGPEDRPGYILYGGVGHHRWDRSIRSTATVTGLEETYEWQYAALGAGKTFLTGGRTSWQIDLRLQRTLSPRISVDLRNADPVELALGEKTGARLSALWSNQIRKDLKLGIEPYYERWELGRSATQNLTRNGVVVGTVFEPRSVTNNRGIVISITSPLADHP